MRSGVPALTQLQVPFLNSLTLSDHIYSTSLKVLLTPFLHGVRLLYPRALISSYAFKSCLIIVFFLFLTFIFVVEKGKVYLVIDPLGAITQVVYAE